MTVSSRKRIRKYSDRALRKFKTWKQPRESCCQLGEPSLTQIVERLEESLTSLSGPGHELKLLATLQTLTDNYLLCRRNSAAADSAELALSVYEQLLNDDGLRDRDILFVRDLRTPLEFVRPVVQRLRQNRSSRKAEHLRKWSIRLNDLWSFASGD
jgi:hypothetical protein